jgi:arabinose-5-phosphate isomerase
MHAADAVHGDLGIIQTNDVVICLSKSGNTPEIKVLVPLLKSSGNCLVAIVGDKTSFLGQHADYVLDVSVEKEACPHNLAPTTSTTMQLVMGDVLAICLLNARGFTSADFARFHPGGSLGKRLYMRLNDMVDRNNRPAVEVNDNILKVITVITARRFGATAVMENNQLAGVITDGDIRRMLEKNGDTSGLKASDIMGNNPVTMEADEMARDAAQLMTERKISQILVTENGSYIGMCHIHEFHKEGIV